MRKILGSIVFSLLGLAIHACPVDASTLDQQYTPSSPGGFIIGGVSDAQTFTVGISGNLTAVALDLEGSGANSTGNISGDSNTTINVAIVQVQSGVPIENVSGAGVLATGSISGANLAISPTFVTVAFSPFQVSAGEQLAIVAYDQSSYEGALWITNDCISQGPCGTYAGGRMYLENGTVTGNTVGGNGAFGSTWGDYPGQSLANGDFGFQTFVAPVPLSTSAWLLLSGLAGLGFLGRKRLANSTGGYPTELAA